MGNLLPRSPALDGQSTRSPPMRFRLRTLLIVLAMGPPVLWFGWTKYEAWRAEQKDIQARRAGGTLTLPIIIEDEESITGSETPVKPKN
jgi:hypothetical protein